MRGRFETPCETCQGLKPSRPPLIAFVVRVLIALLVVVGWLLWSPTNAEAVLNSLPNETPHLRLFDQREPYPEISRSRLPQL